mgnify:CR=1 FL=1
MSNTQYAVCHLQRGSGNDSGMSCHIERKDAKGKVLCAGQCRRRPDTSQP